MKEYGSCSPLETKSLGENLARDLKPGDIIALSGPLGAGKTTLIQGLAAGLKVKDYITSPSFILINEYDGRLPLYHIDLYRLENLKQIEELGIDEYFEKGGITIIEWAEKMKELLPPKTKKINIEVIDENTRNIQCN